MSRLVSIIVPVYNVEEYLPHCIESLIGQSYNNIEILLINDGSTDNSGEICDYYASVDNRIKVFHKVNGGLSDARNWGLTRCKGEYISFVDSDDFVHPDFISSLYSAIGESDLALCNYLSFSVDSDVKYTDVEKENITTIDKDKYLSELVELDKVKLIVAWNKLYKKHLWNDFTFVKGVLHEDEFAIHHIINNCKSISVTNRSLYFYRQRINSITSNKRNKKSFEHKLMAYYDRYVFYKSNSMSHEANVMLRHILYRCVMRTVKKDNHIWMELGKYRTIINTKGLSFSIRALLLIKVWSYPLYQKIMSLKD